MGEKNQSFVFNTEPEAKEYADLAKASEVNGYSEVYVEGPYKKTDGLWHVKVKTYYG
jgi:hypothetical protein